MLNRVLGACEADTLIFACVFVSTDVIAIKGTSLDKA
jgi:hypothetical protein